MYVLYVSKKVSPPSLEWPWSVTLTADTQAGSVSCLRLPAVREASWLSYSRRQPDPMAGIEWHLPWVDLSCETLLETSKQTAGTSWSFQSGPKTLQGLLANKMSTYL